LNTLEAYYVDTVDYFGKMKSRADVMLEKRAYLVRWPQRSYEMQENSIAVVCGQGTNLCDVSGLIDWTAYSAPRNKRASGVATFSFRVDIRLSPGKIVTENSAVVSRSVPLQEAEPVPAP
jgi:hypothetical protein